MELEDNFEKANESESKKNLTQINATKDSIISISTEAYLNNSNLSSITKKIFSKKSEKNGSTSNIFDINFNNKEE